MALDEEELKAIFLIALMTGRRRGEILQLKQSDIKNGTVYVPQTITKTKTPDMFPLPNEVLEIIRSLPLNKDGTIFTSTGARVTRVFTRLIQSSKILLSKGSKFTLHDTRHLFQSVMISETNNPQLVDRCLSHSQDGSMMSVYLSFSYQKREKVFNQYWDIAKGV
jgi:integrase